MNMSYSERKIQQIELEEFEDRLDKLLHGYGEPEDVIWLLAAAVHNEAVQEVVNDRYLEMQGYNLEELEEEGEAFFKSILEANDNEGSDGESLPT